MIGAVERSWKFCFRGCPAFLFLKEKKVVDIPAGTGYSSKILRDIGASVEAYDLFPELFKVDGVECIKADMQKNLPIESSYANIVLHQ